MKYLFREVSIRGDLPLFSELNKVYGIGYVKSKYLCDLMGINLKVRLDSIPSYRFYLLANIIRKRMFSEVSLRRRRYKRFLLLSSLSSYKSFKLKNGLPMRGQSTKRNASTSRRLKFKHNISKV